MERVSFQGKFIRESTGFYPGGAFMARVRQRFDMTKAGYTLIDVLAVAPLPIRAATGAQKFPGCVLCG